MSEKHAGKRRPISASLRREVLAEAGYRCALPDLPCALHAGYHRAGGDQRVENDPGFPHPRL